MAKLRRRVIYTTVRWEETDPLTEEQIKNWKSEDEELQDEIDDFIIDYRHQVRTELPVLDIGLPKGVKRVEHYTAQHVAGVNEKGEKPRLPGHVAASIHYNERLAEYQDQVNPRIVTGNKIQLTNGNYLSIVHCFFNYFY